MHAGPRPHVDQVVGLHDGLLVMFHHQHGVAQVAQPLEGVQQARIVPLVQADGGLIQDVEHAHQRRSDLGGQADALPLAAGEGAGGTVEGEVVQPHVDQKRQALAYLLEDSPGDLLLLVGKFQSFEKGQAVADGKGGDVPDGAAAHQHVQRLGPEARSLAGGTGHDVHILFQLFPGGVRFGLAPAPLQVVQNPLELLLVGMAPSSVLFPPEFDLFAPGTVQDHVTDMFGQLLEGGADVEFIGLGQRIQDQVEPAREPFFPGRDGPFPQGELRVGDHQFGVEVHAGAQAGAVRAGAVGVVEREQPRRNLLVGDAAIHAGQLLGKD